MLLFRGGVILLLLTLLGIGIYMIYDQSDNRLATLQDAKAATVMIINVPDISTPHLYSGGSGAIISPDGYIVTNNHVTQGYSKLYVVLSDHSLHEAKLVGSFPETDLSLLKIRAKDLTYFEFYEEPILSGQEVYAIGAPFFLEQSMSYGIISSLKRDDAAPNSLTYYLQANIACNPGNSGGPLINPEGKLVGINSWIRITPIPDSKIVVPNSSFCFAIPSRVVSYVVGHLKDNKKIRPKTIGAEIENIDYMSAQIVGFDKVLGVQLKNIEPLSPADQAGLKLNDIIIEYNNEEINSVLELKAEINLSPVGESMHAIVWREGEEMEVGISAQYQLDEKEYIYSILIDVYKSCQLDLKCRLEKMQQKLETETSILHKTNLKSVIEGYERELQIVGMHEQQCQDELYLAAKNHLDVCYIGVFERQMSGEDAKFKDKKFIKCAKEQLNKLWPDNGYAKAGLDIISQSNLDSNDKEQLMRACMLYWVTAP